MLSTRNLKAGDVLDGRYRLERRIGGGGMGDVWEGTDTILWRTVAIKILLADLVDDRGFRERFRREARAIAVMQGPGVVEVYDYGEIEDEDAQLAYLIMEYVDGKPLSRLLGLWGKLEAPDAMRVMGGVAQALHVAHAAGIVHRDIKPGNILVRADGSVVLVDFGIARVSHNLTLTTTGVVLGTVTYMSPEQAAGENLSAASDLYSLGVVAHQCLAGSPPFRADTPLGVLSAHLRNAPPPLPADVPYEVSQIVRRALEKDPSARWPDAASLAAACHETRERMLANRRGASPVRTKVMPEPHDGSSPQAVSPVRATGAHRRARGVAGPVTGANTLPPLTGAHTGAHATGAHTGANPVPPSPPPEPAPEPEHHRRRGMWMSLIGTIAGLAAVGAIALTLPWGEPDGTGRSPADDLDVNGAELQGQVGEDGEWAGDYGDDEERSASPEPSESATDGEDASPEDPAASAGPSLNPSGSATPTESSSPTSPAKSTVPNVVSKNEADARSSIEESGLNPTVEYEGEGDARCTVVRQYPKAGDEVEEGSTVQLTIRKAADAESCKTESEETPTPGEGAP
ncbi:protein kinase [Glycomyces sp. NPDC046736]|uniref:serine/threonine-protein kinase n=1 Tax=Glycomyces sp. NPDC046736 TaxID=3155615 RepID=UPI0033DF9214